VERLNTAEALTAEVRAAVRATPLSPGFRTWVTGTAPAYFDLDRQSAANLLHAERIGIPVTLVILLVLFGAPIAASLPLVLALAAVTIASAALYLLSFVTSVSVFSQNIVSMIGLGLGVDYALFMLTSFRRAVAHGHSDREAVVIAVQDSGHMIVVSGTAVAAAFASLLLVNVPFIRSMALGGIVIVMVAVAAALTLLPAVLSFLGRTVNWPRTQDVVPGEGLMRRPWTSLFAGGGVVMAFAVACVRLQPWNIGVQDLSLAMEARQGYEMLKHEFEEGLSGPTVLHIETSGQDGVWNPAVQKAVSQLALRLSEDVRVAKVTGLPDLVSNAATLHLSIRSSADLPDRLRQSAADIVSASGGAGLLVVVPTTAPESADSMRLADDLRRDTWPEFRGLAVRVGVSGTAAHTRDFDDEVFGRLPLVMGALLSATFLLLVVSFRSVLLPLKAILLNLLSVLASYGFLVYVFQDGLGARWIGLVPPGGLNSFIVLVLFTVLFGLSMDYEVFLLSRVQTEYMKTGDNVRAVTRALEGTAGTITSAAVIMVSIFICFGFTTLVATREFGLGLAFAVALDATVIRLVMAPALLAILGAGNWWMPRHLDSVLGLRATVYSPRESHT
jgi:RND superfamily putative drug exporter